MRLIDADKMRENLAWCKEQSGSNDSFWDDVIERLDVQPTVDAVPVRRGRWIDMGDATVVCSECNNQIIGELDYNFCPCCGADMREVEKDG